MGKRRETSTEDDLSLELSDLSPSPKKHKKHKHKKHKRSKNHHEGDMLVDVRLSHDQSPGVDKSSKSQVSKQTLEKPGISPLSQPGVSPRVKKKKRRDSATSSEEERWLDAIESGKLEEVDDELKKIKPKDPKLMTARQRAMYDRGGEMTLATGEVLMALPSGYKEKVMTAEAIQKAALKSQKRKQMADEKREKDKKKTMERLLKKQESKTGKMFKGKMLRLQVPFISYKNNKDGITLSFPNEMRCPLQKQMVQKVPSLVFCQVAGCNNPKKYNCNKTNTALCSLRCYKKNFELLRKIII